MLQEIIDLNAFCEKQQSSLEQSTQQDLQNLILEIKQNIITHKDKALLNYTKTFDKVNLNTFKLKVSHADIKNAYQEIPKNYLNALKKAQQNITQFHQKQLPKNISYSPEKGLQLGISYIPLEKAALYVPGGRNPYPSSVLMNAIPACIAGVKQAIVLTPPNPNGDIDPSILVAADLCGVTEIYKVGGAQAIFAAAYGTESIPKVDKITGPGNCYVTAAKQAVYGKVDIDKPAGPSEVLVYCDEINMAHFAAAELLAQMEHDPLASAVLVCSSAEIASSVNMYLNQQFKSCLRQDIIKKAINQSGIYIEPNLSMAIDCINLVASEHLVLLSKNEAELLKHIKHGSSLFIGPYTPVAIGDYYAGPNHVLPTNTAARYSSPLSVHDFLKFRTETSCSKDYINKHADAIMTLASQEALDAHAKSVSIRKSTS